MNGQDRKTLKEYFKKGKAPTEEQFAELIDSVPNLMDDGQVARTAKGWAFYPKHGGSMDIGLYTEKPTTETGIPVWTFAVTPEKQLIIRNAKGEAVVEAAQDKSVVIHGSLTVEAGEPTPAGGDYLIVPADKQWHDLPVDVSGKGFGCRVYSIYASFRERGTELCQLTRATALWLNSMEHKIESPQKHWWGWSGGVGFRWQKIDGSPCLQMRSKQRLPSGKVHCRVVEMYKG